MNGAPQRIYLPCNPQATAAEAAVVAAPEEERGTVNKVRGRRYPRLVKELE